MVIAIDNQLNIRDLTQVSIDNFMVLAKHKLKMKPQDKSFGLHVRSCGSCDSMEQVLSILVCLYHSSSICFSLGTTL